jgi:hypothetical protein
MGTVDPINTTYKPVTFLNLKFNYQNIPIDFKGLKL